MGSPTHDQSALEKAKTEMNELNKKAQADLDSLRTAPITEIEKRINSLESTLKLSQESAVVSVEEASSTSDAYIHTLETCLKQEHQRIISLENEHRAYNEDAKAKYDGVIKDLDLARRLPADLQKELENVKEQSHNLQKESDEVQERTNGLLNELVDMRQHEIYLTAELETAKKRVSAMESVFDVFRSGISRFDEHMTALVSSSKEQSNPTRPSSAPAQPNNQQSNAKEGDDGLQVLSDQTNPQALTSQPRNGNDEAESTRSFCEKILQVISDQKYREYNKSFLGCFRFPDSMDLTVMGEKLQNGAYMSAASFQTDFDLMINECKNDPGSVRHVASEKLKEIFDEAWSAVRASDPAYRQIEPQDRTAGGQNNRGHKRKASTEGPFTSEGNATARRQPAPSHLNQRGTQPASLAHGEDLTPALPQSEQTATTSEWRPETGLYAWRGKVATVPYMSIDRQVKFLVTAKLVSATKSPSTFQAPWTELLPKKLPVRARRMPGVEDPWNLEFDPSGDILILHLTPSSKTEEVDFDYLCDDLISRRRWAVVNHGNSGYIKSLNLIPAPTSGVYPACLSGLDRASLPPMRTRNTLFLVVIFRVGLPEQRLVRMAWDHLIETVHRAEDMEAIDDARNCISHHLLPIHNGTRRRMSVGKEYMTLLEGLPFAPPGPTLATCSDHFLNLSFFNADPAVPRQFGRPNLPSRVFILGGMIQGTELVGLVVVDLQHRKRPVWEICKRAGSSSLGDTMILLRRSCRASWKIWALSAFADYGYNQGDKRYYENLGLKVERCRHLV